MTTSSSDKTQLCGQPVWTDRGRETCKEPASAPHPCPYQKEIHDSELLCECCPKCTAECEDNI